MNTIESVKALRNELTTARDAVKQLQDRVGDDWRPDLSTERRVLNHVIAKLEHILIENTLNDQPSTVAVAAHN